MSHDNDIHNVFEMCDMDMNDILESGNKLWELVETNDKNAQIQCQRHIVISNGQCTAGHGR